MAHVSNQPIVRMAEVEIDPARLESYKALLMKEIEVSIQTEPGVLMLYAMSVKDSPAHIRLVEVYSGQEAYDSHLQSVHFLKYKTLTSGMVRSLRLIETDPILLYAKPGGG